MAKARLAQTRATWILWLGRAACVRAAAAAAAAAAIHLLEPNVACLTDSKSPSQPQFRYNLLGPYLLVVLVYTRDPRALVGTGWLVLLLLLLLLAS